MKILHLLYSGLGGHGNVFFSMVDADVDQVFEYEALFNGVENIRTEYIERCTKNQIKWSFIKKKRGLDLRFYFNLAGKIRSSGSDIIFLHGSTQVLWAKLAMMFSAGKRTLFVRETQANHLKTKQDWFWLIAALLLADRIIFLSEAYKAEIQKKLAWIYPKKKVTVIANGIDLQKYSPALKNTEETIVLGMQSRIVPIKDHPTLLAAFALLVKDITNPCLLKIAGDGESRTAMEQLAKQLGIEKRVLFMGMLTEEDLIKFLDELDIYIHASCGETMSTAIMQAMASGKPVIASDVAGINNMITNNDTGILVPVKDAQAMFDKMKWLIMHKVEAQKLAINARQYAEHHFSNESMFNKYKTEFLKQ